MQALIIFYFVNNIIITRMGAQLCPANQENLIQELKYDLAKPTSVANVQNGRQISIQTNETRSSSQRYNDLRQCQNKKQLQNIQNDCNGQNLKIKEYIQQVTPISKELHKKQSQIQLPNKTLFKGITINDIPNGYGQQFHQNGDIFGGSFLNGEKNGLGRYKFVNNEQYEGEFSGNMMHGKGTYRFSNGDTYIGEFVNNCREGLGRYILKQPNQLKIEYFEGQYKQNERHGQGLVKYINGQTYKGLWKNDILVRTR